MIYSIFGICEAAAAEVLIKEGKATKIPKSQIPKCERKNETGQKAMFALIVPDEHIDYFNDVISDLRM